MACVFQQIARFLSNTPLAEQNRFIMKGIYVVDFFNKNKMLPLFCAAFFMTIPLFAQDKLIEKANEHYKLNQFAEAAGLFEQALGEMGEKGKAGRSGLNLKTKLAYCYRMNNKMDKAESLYAEVVQHESSKADTYYYYGEALMSNGKYEEARKWFTDYQKLEPSDEKAALMIESCDKVPLIQPYFQYVEIQEFAWNSTADDNAPIAWKNGVLFSSDREQGVKLLKEKSGWTGRDYLDLYFSEKKEDGTYDKPEQFSSKLSEVNKNTGNASITADGSQIFFTRNDNILNKQNSYNLQLFSAQTAGEDRWKSVNKLSFCSPNFNFMHPAVSQDGKWLFFVTNKSGGEGGTDLWVSQRSGDDWGKPENLGPVINTPANEGFPFLDHEGRLYFCSKGHPGYGGFDIFMTEKDENGNWKAPLNLGKPINSSLDDISIFVATDRRSGMFTSSRNGGDDDIYLFKVLDEAPVEQPVVQAATTEAPQHPSTSTVTSGEKEEKKKSDEPVSKPEKRVIEQITEVVVQESEPLEPEPDPVETAPSETQTPPLPESQKTVSDKPVPTSPFLSQPVFPKAPPVEEIKQAEVAKALPEPALEEPETVVEEVSAPALPETPAEVNPETTVAKNELSSFDDFIKKLEHGQLGVGDHFRLDGAIYDPNIWQLTPRIAVMLDKVVEILRHFPNLVVEIGAYTESPGAEEDNLKLSQNRAEMAVDYIVREGIPIGRLSAKGYGETAPLNHCRNGVNCTEAEHLVNQRLEVKILRLDGSR